MKIRLRNYIIISNVFFVLILMTSSTLVGTKKKKNLNVDNWRYEIEAVGTGVEGSYQIKVWNYAKDTETAVELAKKNAVHGIIFKGFPNNGRIQGQKALARDPNLEEEKKDFFTAFFSQDGKYQKFVTLVDNGNIGPGDRIKLNKKEYKIGVIVNVNVAGLRKDLEAAGVIKSLSFGF